MKRFILFSFIVIVAVTVLLPAPKSQASKKSAPKFPKISLQDAKAQDPHANIFSQTSVSSEVSKQTKDVASVLPPAKSNPINFTAKSGGPGRLPTNNIIDREIFNVLISKGITPADLASDEEFIRRVSLDITGRQPSPERLLQYIADKDLNKKSKLIDELINSEAYVDRWTQWFGDLTRNYTIAQDLSGRDRNAQYLYLRDAVSKNKPFNQMATDFITFNGVYDQGPGGFLVRPVFNTTTPQDAYDEITAEVSRTFLGTQAVCISCHDGQGHLEQVNLYFSNKKRSDYWGISSFFAQTSFTLFGAQNELVRISTDPRGFYNASTREGMRPPRSGGVIEPSFALFGEGKPTPSDDRRVALAKLLTNDIQFSRAFVNRVFAHFFTVGLVDPVDQFDLARLDPNNPPSEPWDLQASHPVLLNDLAVSFQKSGYNLQNLIRLIANSQAYGLSSRYEESKWKEEYARLYARKLVRRLQAEEVLDSITTSTFRPGAYAAMGFSKAFSSAMALPGVEEPLLSTISRNNPPQSDDPYVVYKFLQEFGRGDRNTVFRSNTGSLTQAFDLFNSELLIGRINNPSALPTQLAKNLQAGKATPQEAITFLYLLTIGRQPSEKELEKLKGRITGGPEAIADIQWALFNRLDFLYNY
jgi:hypothetical protein